MNATGGGVVVDAGALVAGLVAGSVGQRRELSRYVVDASEGGRVIVVPALALLEACQVRPVLGKHLAGLAAALPDGALTVGALARDHRMDALRDLLPDLPWPATHVVHTAVSAGWPVVTTDPGA